MDAAFDWQLFDHCTRKALAGRYNGDLRNLWESLDDDGSGMISLNELAPDEKQLLDLFFTSVKQEYGSLRRGFRQARRKCILVDAAKT